MKNCLIFGFGRSGTSMMGGVLSQSGYPTGENSYAPRISNPPGFFEDERINRVDELLLAPFDGTAAVAAAQCHGKRYSPCAPNFGHRWLTLIDPAASVLCDRPDLLHEMATMTEVAGPFAYKDPRFSLTLTAWLPLLGPDTRYVGMFRDPEKVARSVLIECATASYLWDFHIDCNLAYQLWTNWYSRILEVLLPLVGKAMLFVSYDHFFAARERATLEAFLEAGLDSTFADPSLNRTAPAGGCPEPTAATYRRLLELSHGPTG